MGRCNDPNASVELRILHDFGFFGHYLHLHAGGRSGKQHILAHLLRHDGHLTQRELLESSNISSAALSEVLAKLEAEGLVERTRSDEDRRQQQVALTEEGSRRACEIQGKKRSFEEHAFEVLSLEEREQLVATLDRLVDHWNSDTIGEVWA